MKVELGGVYVNAPFLVSVKLTVPAPPFATWAFEKV